MSTNRNHNQHQPGPSRGFFRGRGGGQYRGTFQGGRGGGGTGERGQERGRGNSFNTSPFIQYLESEITIPQKYSGRLVGKQQQNQRALEAESKTKLFFSEDCFHVQPGNENRPVTIKIQGAKDDIDLAKLLIKNFLQNIDESKITITIPQKFIKRLVGQQQWNQRAIEVKSRTELYLPRDCFLEEPGNEDRPVPIIIRGRGNDIKMAKFLIFDFVRTRENPEEEIMSLPRGYYSLTRLYKMTVRRESGCGDILFGDEDFKPTWEKQMIPRAPPPNLGATFEIKIIGSRDRIQLAKSLYNYLMELNPIDVGDTSTQ